MKRTAAASVILKIFFARTSDSFSIFFQINSLLDSDFHKLPKPTILSNTIANQRSGK